MSDRPKTALITSRYDIKALATIAKFYKEQGTHIANKSTLPFTIVNDFEQLLIMNNLVAPITSTLEAKQFLEHIGISVIAPQVQKQYLKQLETESIVSEDPITESQDHTNEGVMDAVRTSMSLNKNEGA